MRNPLEIAPEYLGKMVWYKLKKAEQAKYNGQQLAPAMILMGWINEYQQEADPEYRVGLNLRVFPNEGEPFKVFSAKRCKENTESCIFLEDTPEGEYWESRSLIMQDRNMVALMKREEKEKLQKANQPLSLWQKFILWCNEPVYFRLK